MKFVKFLALSAAPLLGLALTLDTKAQSFVPTQQQIEQFKRLSPSEQKALARSMGVNLDDIESLVGQAGASKAVEPDKVSGNRNAKGSSSNANSANIGGEEQGEDDADQPQRSDYEDEDVKAKKEIAPEVPIEPKLRMFGYDMFNFGADAFEPATDIPIPLDYVLGPGDTLVVQLYGKESSDYSLTLNRDGTIQFPELGPISLAGLTYSQASEKINEVVSEQMIGIKSSVTMGPLRTIRVFVLGEVKLPGSYVVGSLSTMTNAIFASGGIKKMGSLRKIQLKRAGRTITELDLYDLLLAGDNSKDRRLQSGDVLFVPPIGGTAAVSGAVKRPAIYELKNENNAQQLIALAGGLLPTAYLPESKIERVAASGEKVLVDIDLSDTSASKIKIQDADFLSIGSTLDEINGSVQVSGHIKREALYPWVPGQHVSDLVDNVEDFKELPDLDFALIERLRPESREIEIITFSPRKALAKPGGEDDPLLHALDKLLFFGFEEDRSELLEDIKKRLQLQASHKQRQKVVRVDGSIRYPGDYPMSENMSAKDLIRMAGGYTESAIGREAELTRYDVNAARERVMLHLEVDFDIKDPLLEPGDSLRVKQIPLWGDKESITLVGEFLHPGTYSILPGETLVDVMRRAGGLTPQAFPQGAIFSRAELRELEEERLEELKRQIEADIAASQFEASTTRKDIDKSKAENILENIDGVRPLGRMVIDLPQIMQRPEVLNFQVIDGDVINVPRFKPSVTVVGEVYFPTSHFHTGKLTALDYIESSGGYKPNADKKRVYVIRANGSVVTLRNHGWYGKRNVEMQPGDTIVIPVDTKRVDKLTLWSSISQIISSSAVGLTSAIALSRL